MSAPPRIAVLISGGGTNLQAIIDAIDAGTIHGRIAVVVSNRRKAFGLERARRAGIATRYLPYKGHADRPTYDAALARLVAEYSPDLIVLAGFMRILTPVFLGAFPDKVINLHPALPGMFAGTHAIERAHNAAQAGEVDHSGVMVHRVIEEVDAGPVLGTARVEIPAGMSLEAFEAEMHATEHRLLVSVVADECRRIDAARTAALTWPTVGLVDTPADYKIFQMMRRNAAHPATGKVRPYSILRTVDWVNVIALTPEGGVVLVRQYRHGTEALTIEIPGGMVDGDETFIEAGARELREESGYTADTWIDLGVVEPNPAFQTNRCGTVLALDARRTEELDLDEGEVIEVLTAPLAEVRQMCRDGRIAHSLVIAGFFHFVEFAGGWRRPDVADDTAV